MRASQFITVYYLRMFTVIVVNVITMNMFDECVCVWRVRQRCNGRCPLRRVFDRVYKVGRVGREANVPYGLGIG